MTVINPSVSCVAQSLNALEKKPMVGISIMPITEAIKPYSIAVDPLSSERKRLACLAMAITAFELPFRRN